MKVIRNSALIASALLTLLFVWRASAEAAYVYTPITFAYNGSNYDKDHSYPIGNPVTLGGVPFNIPDGSSGGLNIWDSDQGAGQYSITINVGVKNVQEVYTLINTTYGQSGNTYSSITFTFSGGVSYVRNLIDGVDVRDWWEGGNANSISGTTRQVYSGTGYPDPHLATRVDMQTTDFTSSIYKDLTLESITLTDWGASGLSRDFLYGVTVASTPVPLPGALLLFAPGLIGLVAARIRFKG